MKEFSDHPFFTCVDEYIKLLGEKHSKFLKENNLSLENATLIAFDYKPNGRIGYSRITDYNPEINNEIENILDTCADKHLTKK